MLDVLNFVKGAVAKRDLLPTLTHFHIAGGRILGYNGRIALSSPIGLDIDACPLAQPFVRAIEACTEEVALNLTASGRLSVRSGSFRANIACTTEEFPAIAPTGEHVTLSEDFLTALATLVDFTAEDASRLWANAVLFRGDCAYATNNVVAVEYKLGTPFPVEIAVPATAIRELLRIKELPESVQVTSNSATFHYSEGRWLNTTLYNTAWPDIGALVQRPHNAEPIPDGFFAAAANLKPFVDELKRIYMMPGFIGTAPRSDEGANYALPEITVYGCYNVDQLQRIEKIATHADLTAYPAPFMFSSEKIRGAMVGLK